ncbi:hypothetical protein Tsubulata_007227 [Turnera subulata]|uniref:Uncharacterized protein n=1 Tax=Turnera subulata TaxID=218843 RepID=A0A9Q0J1V1_9ROSI|nr:hypothetical protein Tsubulata_007227 [Turnera subulata]
MVPAMASEDVKAVSTTIVNLAEEAKLSIEGVKAPSPALLSIAKSLVTGGVAEELYLKIRELRFGQCSLVVNSVLISSCAFVPHASVLYVTTCYGTPGNLMPLGLCTA